MTVASAIEIHPLALRVPAMTEVEFAALKADIAENGLLRAITMYDGRVLDGRHRLRACEETGTEPLFDEYDGDSPAAFVLSLNARRRNLSPSQLAALAVDFLPELEREAKARQGAAFRDQPRDDRGHTQPVSVSGDTHTDPRRAGQPARAAEEAGALVGVSGVSVARAKRVQREDPEAFERVKAGEVTVNAADTALRERVKQVPTRDGSRKRSAEELVTRVLSKLVPTVAALEHFDWAEAITSDAPLLAWEKQLTEVIVPLGRLRGDIRKVLS